MGTLNYKNKQKLKTKANRRTTTYIEKIKEVTILQSYGEPTIIFEFRIKN